jgi:pimeloyl-ACP methyl ester carboxylesterase
MFEDLGAALGDRFHVLAPDLPGHGDSDPIASEPGSDVPLPFRIAESLVPWLASHGLDRVVLVGASLGGLTSLALADLRPGSVAGIALIDVGHRLEPEGVRRIVDFMVAHESFADLEEAAAAIAEYLPGRRAPRVESLTRNLRRRDDGRWEWKHGVGRNLCDRWASGDGTHPADDLDRLLSGVEEAAGRLTCPVLVLRGERSDVLSAEAAGELEDLIPDARVEVVEKAGHLAVGDNPRGAVALVAAWLDSLRLAGEA